MIGLSYSLETIVVDLITYLRTVLVSVALTWLGYRTWQVVTKPVDDLINLLGLEVPTAPKVSLAAVKSDGFALHWKAPSSRSSIVKHHIRLNGIIVGETAPSETSISVTGLKPEHYYNVRVVAVNSSNFSAASCPIRVKTSSGDRFESPEIDLVEPGNVENGPNQPPKIQQYKLLNTSIPSPVAPSMTREHSGSQSQVRRMTATRRNSPATAMHEQSGSPTERRGSCANVESLQQLTEKLEGLRRETDEVEKQLAEEEEEYNATRQNLLASKDKVKQELKDKEDKSRDIRKEVTGLERQSAQAQNKKQAKERILRQKQSERKRMEEDMSRWTREIQENEEGAARMQSEESHIHATHEEQIRELQSQHDLEVTKNKTAEEILHATGLRVKHLEDQRKEEHSTGKDTDDTDGDLRESEEIRIANEQMSRLHQQYTRAYERLRQAKVSLAQSQQTLEYLQQSQPTQSHLFSPTPSLDNAAPRSTSLRRRQFPPFRTLDSSPNSSFAVTTGTSHPGSIASISPSFSSAPWLSMNTMTLSDSAPASSMSQPDFEQLTGGAPMSPTAQDLLPAGLLVDDPSEERATRAVQDERSSDSSHSGSQSRIGFHLGDHPGIEYSSGDRSSGVFSGVEQSSGAFPLGENWSGALNASDKLPGLGAVQERRFSGFGAHATRNVGADHPQSPVSVSSRSPSLFTSPRDSAPNLHQTASDSIMDSDRRSVRSTGSNRAIGGAHSRFSNLFGFGRPRTNTNPESDGLPILGSLPSHQSQSMPRQDQPVPDPTEAQRRAGSRSTHLLGHVSNVLGRSSARNIEGSVETSLTSLLRQRSLAKTKENTNDRWPSQLASDNRPKSPRPLSTHSSELPRPADDALINAFHPLMGRQSSPLGADWLGMTSTHSFSRHPSRRASEQYSQSGGFPFGETLLESDPADIPSVPATPPLAPIGTKPSKKSQNVPRLNPAAKSFSIFSRDKKADKVDKADKPDKAKSKSKSKEKEATATAEEEKEEPTTDDSPSDPRFSKDTPSIYTTDSQTDPGESLERPNSQTPSLSLTPSESQTPSSATKESKWHHKITRKGSTSSFPILPGLSAKGSVKGKASGLFSSRKDKNNNATSSNNAESAPPSSEAIAARDEGEDDNSPAPSKSTDMTDDARGRGSGGGLSWSSLTKRMNWKGDKTPSIGETSTASEVPEEETEDFFDN
ncbi:MAG: hypothetical protein M1822_009851 [Bathelium mastoideum]|nr:MAG: hypothetical protein M1822_009851 [Bathelium mastoideum]